MARACSPTGRSGGVEAAVLDATAARCGVSGATARRAALRVEAAEPVLAVDAAEVRMADRRRVLDRGAALRPAQASGVVSGSASTSWRHRRASSGSGFGEQGLERFAAADADHVVGVLAGGKLDEAQGSLRAEERQSAGCGADRGLLAGAVAVEAQDRRWDRAATCARAAPR